MYKLVVFSALLALAAAKPSGIIAPAAVAAAPVAYAAPAIAAPVAYAAPAVHAPIAYSAPVVAAPAPVAISKTVHYANTPVVTGYTSQILKPNLGALATPLNTVTQQRVLAPARSVATITPQITQVHPELHVQKVPVDVPVPQPVVSEVEVRHVAPVVHAAPAVVAHSPAVVHAPAVAAAPAVIDARAYW